MSNQAQVGSSTNPTELTKDTAFKNIYYAFQLGWSIIELKSRILTTAPGTNTHQQSKPLVDTANPGQNQAVQLFSRESQVQESQQYTTALPDSAWLTSLWRATFNRIVECHKCCFPDGTTAGTLYDIPAPLNSQQYEALKANPSTYDASTMYLPYRYLKPPAGQSYSDVGVQLDPDVPAGFTLYDVTRRALNCLTLLLTNPEVNLLPVTVEDCQNQLIKNVQAYNQLDAAIKAVKISENAVSNAVSNQQVDPKTQAIRILSDNATRFLETWDTYARETLYARGGNDVQANEIQLVAYEAGRAMASLSWGITITIIPIETKVSQAQKNNELAKELVQAWQQVFDERSIASLQQQVSALSTAMDDAYYRVHPDLSRPNPNNPAERTNLALPSQTIQAVTFSLEYWKRAVQRICSDQPQTNQENLPPGDAKKPGANSATPGSNGAHKIIAIPGMTGDTSKALRLALVQQAEIWQPLLLHQQSLLDFTTQYVTQHILNDFMNECERATAQEIQNEIKKFRVPLIIGGGVILLLLVSIILLFIVFPGSYQTLASGFALIIGGIVGFFGTVAARLSSIFSRSPSSAVTSQGSAGPLTAIPGLAGAALVGAFQDGYNQILVDFDYLNHNISITYPLVEFFIFQSVLRAQEITEKKAIVNTTQVSTTTSNSIFQRIASFFATRDKKSPNTIPTTEVEAVVVETIKDAYDFLTQIVWTNQDRADEIARVARAAFGPIGAFVGAQISLLSAQNNKSATKKK